MSSEDRIDSFLSWRLHQHLDGDGSVCETCREFHDDCECHLLEDEHLSDEEEADV